MVKSFCSLTGITLSSMFRRFLEDLEKPRSFNLKLLDIRCILKRREAKFFKMKSLRKGQVTNWMLVSNSETDKALGSNKISLRINVD